MFSKLSVIIFFKYLFFKISKAFINHLYLKVKDKNECLSIDLMKNSLIFSLL